MFDIPRMPPPTPLPVATKLLGLFVRGFWRRLAEWLPWWRTPQPTSDPVEEFLRGIFEVIAKVEEQVRNGTYQPPEEKPRPPRQAAEREQAPRQAAGNIRPASAADPGAADPGAADPGAGGGRENRPPTGPAGGDAAPGAALG